MPFPSDVEVAIVAHNCRGVLPAALDSLTLAGCPASNIRVVDVASTDGTGDWLRESWPAVTVRRLERNDGPGPGRNVGILETKSRFVLLMDADVQVRPDAVALLYAVLSENPTVKIGSPVVVYADRPQTVQYAGGRLHYICDAVNPWNNRPLAERGADLCDIGVAPTCALLLDRQASIDVGLFDERYFIGKEDGDFTHRVVMAGHKIREVPGAVVLHTVKPRSDWLFYYQIRNRWHFILKNYQLRTIVCLVPVLLVYEPMQFAILAAKGHAGTYFKAVAGLIAMLPALPRDRGLANRIRRRPDSAILVSAPIAIRDDFVGHRMLRWGKTAYERLLNGYWRLLKRGALAR